MNHHNKITVRTMQIALGGLWLLDGALQLQHRMFTSSFTADVIAPAAQGQPQFVSGPMHLAIHLFLLNPALFNSLIVAIQLGLGWLILWKRSTRTGLMLSIPWALFIWAVGEGYGGALSGHMTLLMGAPGAALLYALLALAVMPPLQESSRPKKSQQPAYWLAFLWLAVWTSGAIYQLLPGQNTLADTIAMLTDNAAGAPGWLAAVDVHVASFVGGFGAPATMTTGMHMTSLQMAQMPVRPGSGYLFIWLFAAVQLCIGFGVLGHSRIRQVTIIAGSLLSLLFWFAGQNLGAFYTGLATDPGTAPLLILLGLAILGCPSLDARLAKLWSGLERAIT